MQQNDDSIYSLSEFRKEQNPETPFKEKLNMVIEIAKAASTKSMTAVVPRHQFQEA